MPLRRSGVSDLNEPLHRWFISGYWYLKRCIYLRLNPKQPFSWKTGARECYSQRPLVLSVVCKLFARIAGSFARSVGQEPSLFALIVGREMLLFASRACFMRKLLHLALHLWPVGLNDQLPVIPCLFAGRVQNLGGSQRPKISSAHAMAGKHRRVLLRAKQGKQRACETLLWRLITRALLWLHRCFS